MLNDQQFESPKPGPGQLKMFMTPMEVYKGYQPNPNDRMIKGEHPSDAWDRVSSGRDAPADAVWETDRQLNVRKYEENKKSYPQDQNRQKKGPDLNEWVMQHQQIPGKIHLAERAGYDTKSPVDPTRGVIAGGHHQLAAARAVDPGMLMPVVHHETMGDAYSPDTPNQWRDRHY